MFYFRSNERVTSVQNNEGAGPETDGARVSDTFTRPSPPAPNNMDKSDRRRRPFAFDKVRKHLTLHNAKLLITYDYLRNSKHLILCTYQNIYLSCKNVLIQHCCNETD